VSLFLVWCVGSHDASSHTLRVVRHLPTEICTYSVIVSTVWWWSVHIISCSCLTVFMILQAFYCMECLIIL
jgi:hypothetical protein